MPQLGSGAKTIDGIKPKPASLPQLGSRHKSLGRIKRYRWYIVVLFILVVMLCVGWCVYHRHQIDTATGINELRIVEAEVSKHYLLPTNEVPALATVTNNTQLTTPFLKNAKDGDEILIYEKNQIAIVYRPKIDRIVAVGPVNIVPPTTSN